MNLENFVQKYGKVTEEYKFYNGEVTLRYDVKDHKYLLKTEDGLEEQDGVTSVCHIIDKSQPLMAWACKVMAKKLLDTMPTHNDAEMVLRTNHVKWCDFEKLVLEAKKAKDEHLEDAGTVGHAAHAWIEGYIRICIADGEISCQQVKLSQLSKFADMDPRAVSCCRAMLDWATAHNVRFLQTERKVYSRKYKFAGTMDGLALVDSCDNPRCCPTGFINHLSIIDWKTSNYLYLEYLLQTAAYQQAWMEMMAVDDPLGQLVTDRWVIRLGKDDAEFDPWHMTWDDFTEDLEAFGTCLTLSRQVARLEARIKERSDREKAILKAEKKAAREAKAAVEAESKALARAEKKRQRLEAVELKKAEKKAAKQAAKSVKVKSKETKGLSLGDILGERKYRNTDCFLRHTY